MANFIIRPFMSGLIFAVQIVALAKQLSLDFQI
jgi:hypothetical protein